MLTRRRLRAAVVTTATLACIAGTVAVVGAETFSACYPIVGYVRDAADRPLSGARASVATSCNGPNVVYTGADGRYRLYVAGGSLGTTAAVAVTKTGFVSGSQNASAKPKVGANPVMVPKLQMEQMTTSSYSSSEYSVGPTEEVALYDEADVETTNSDFRLLMAFSPAVAPAALRPGETVSFSVRVLGAPPGYSSAYETGVVAHRAHDGVEVPLVASATDAEGFTTWTGSTTIPAGEADGARAIDACAVKPGFTGRCAGAPAASLLSSLVARGYAVDATPPVLESADPVAYGTYSRLYSVTARWADATAGLASYRVLVDGAPRSLSVSGTTAYGSLSGLAPGIHTLELEATDKAGNTGRVVRIFTLASVTATPAAATLRSQTVRVNPSGTVPTPTSVRFAAPRADVQGFTETINANTWVGYGQMRRPVTFSAIEVEFVNETGVPKVVTTFAPSTYATHDLALLTPSASAATARIAESTLTLADINVSVPTGYGTPGSQATLKSVVAWLGSPQSTNAQMGATQFVGRVRVAGSIGACASDQPETVDCDNGRITANGRDAMIAPGPRFDDSDLKDAPQCEDAPGVATGAGCVEPMRHKEARARAAFGCAEQANLNFGFGAAPVNLCDIQADALARRQAPSPKAERPFGAAFLNGWMYRAYDPSGGLLYPGLQQSRVDAAPNRGACPNGKHGDIASWVYRASANIVAHDGAELPEHAGTWRAPVEEKTLPGIQRVHLGREHGPYATDESTFEEGTILREDRNYQLVSAPVQPQWSDDGVYHLVRGAMVTWNGTRVPLDGATTTVWEYDPAGNAPDTGLAGVTGSVQLVNGTTFADAPLDGYQRAFSLDFQLVADFTGCE